VIDFAIKLLVMELSLDITINVRKMGVNIYIECWRFSKPTSITPQAVDSWAFN